MMEQSSKISLGQVFGFLWKSFQFMDGQKGRYGLGAVCSFIELGTVYLMPLFISRMIAVIQEGASLWPLLVIFILFLVAAPLIAMTHYPPRTENCPGFSDLLEQYRADVCVYGHLHAASFLGGIRGRRGGVLYCPASCDGLGFRLLQIELEPEP